MKTAIIFCTTPQVIGLATASYKQEGRSKSLLQSKSISEYLQKLRGFRSLENKETVEKREKYPPNRATCLSPRNPCGEAGTDLLLATLMARTVIQVMGRNHIAMHPGSVDLLCGAHSGAGSTLHLQKQNKTKLRH